jgi:probable rRNA maturation factor
LRRRRSPEITVGNRQKIRVRLGTIRKFAGHVLAAEGIAPECELSVVLCDEEEISGLNRTFLRHEGPTDVLAFPQDAPRREPAPPEESTSHRVTSLLGDVVVCTEVALRQAQQRGVSCEEETLELLAHGILHLLGHRDNTPAARRKMFRRQRELLKGFLEPRRKAVGKT